MCSDVTRGSIVGLIVAREGRRRERPDLCVVSGRLEEVAVHFMYWIVMLCVLWVRERDTDTESKQEYNLYNYGRGTRC